MDVDSCRSIQVNLSIHLLIVRADLYNTKSKSKSKFRIGIHEIVSYDFKQINFLEILNIDGMEYTSL